MSLLDLTKNLFKNKQNPILQAIGVLSPQLGQTIRMYQNPAVQNVLRPKTGTIATAGRNFLSQPTPQALRPISRGIDRVSQSPLLQFGSGLIQGQNLGLGRSPITMPQTTAGKIAFGLGSFGGAMNPKGLTQRVIRPIVGATNPLISKAISPATGSIVGGRIAAGLGNVAQGAAINPLYNRKPLEGAAFDFATGVAFGPNQFRTGPIGKGFSLPKPTYDELVKAEDMIKNASKYVGKIKTNARTEKEAIKLIQSQGAEVIERLSAKYLPNKQLTALTTAEQKIKALTDLHYKNGLANLPEMGIVGKKSADKKELATLHNLSASGIEKALENGGLPAPSIAITKNKIPFNDFGEITLVGNKGLIDPKNKDAHVYSGDIYTPRVPRPEYNAKPIRGSKYEQDMIKRNIYYDDFQSLSKERAFDRLTNNRGLMGNQSKPYTGEQANKIIEEVFGEGVLQVRREALGSDAKSLVSSFPNLKNIIKNSQSPEDFRLTVENDEGVYNYLQRLADRKYNGDYYEMMDKIESQIFENVPYTLENQVRKSKEILSRNADEIRGTEQGWGASANPRIFGYKKFESIEDIRASKGSLMPKEKAEAFGTQAETKLENYIDKAGLGSSYSSYQDLIKDVVSKNKYDDPIWIKNYLKQYGGWEKITEEQAGKIGELSKKAYSNVPTDYFEAKLMRPVGLNEFNGALIPDQGIYNKEQIVKSLQEKGLKVVEYDSTKENDRQVKLMDNFGNTFFSSVGGLYGIDRDENGNIVFNPEKAAYGMAIGLGVSKGAKYLKKNVAQAPISDIKPQLIKGKPTPKPVTPTQPKAITSKPIQEIPTAEPKQGQNIPSKTISPEVSSKPIIDPIQKIVSALKEAKPLRGEQEALYAKARSQKFAKMMSARGRVTGEKGFFAEKGALSGSLPKAQFESLRKSLTQTDIDTIFTRANDANIGEWEKLTVKTGLSKVLEGSIPTRNELSLMNEVYGPEFTKALLDKRSTMQKLVATAGDVLNLPRALMSSVDLSAPMRQGIFLIGRPKQWVPAFKTMFKAFASEKGYQSLLDDISSRPTYKLMRDTKLALTTPNSKMAQGEEAFMSNLAERIPGIGIAVRASDRAYTGFLNKLRADVFDDIITRGKDVGLDKDSTFTQSVADFVNSATGRGKLPNALNSSAQALNGVFFSPRLMASRLNLLNPVYYAQLHPQVRKEALKSLLTFAGTGMTILGLSKLAGASVGTDPRSADFGKIKIGDTRYDIWGGFQQYMVLASRLLTGQMVSSTTGKEFNLGEGYKPTTRFDIIQRFFESKEAPVASFVSALIKGQNTMGEKTDVPVEVVNRLLPMMTQDMFDLYREWGPKGLLMGLPGMFGVGSQTYADQIPMAGKTKLGKPNVQWKQAPGLGETIVNKVTGNEVSNIPKEQWGPLLKEKQDKALFKIKTDDIKSSVLETGTAQTVENPFTGKTQLIYLKDGVVTTKDVTPKASKAKVSSSGGSKAKKGAKITIKTPKYKKYKLAKLKPIKVKKLAKIKIKKYKAKKVNLAVKPLKFKKVTVS